MVFSSEIFLFAFLPLVIIVYNILPKKLRNICLVFFSLIFYGWGNFNFLLLIILSIMFNYILAILIEKSIKYKKILLIINIILNLSMLFVFKYYNFVIDLINNLFSLKFNLLELILPIGISFYTFQGLSYTIDVYRGKIPTQKNIIKLALYISFFPQLIAGPIIKYVDIKDALNDREINIDDFVIGIKRFIVGLSKKTLLADNLAVVADSIWNVSYNDLTGNIAWIGAIFYTFQIYFDFSGYSDMAIGLGKMFGFKFVENFDYPYVSKSVSEFWRRWHISLSSWFRDYVYIPLGGKKTKIVRNLLIVFLLTGIWHGAGITFIVWGLWNGIWIVFEKEIFSKLNINKDNIIIKIISHFYLLFVVIIGWVMFRSNSIYQALMFLRAMFFNNIHKFPIFNINWYLNKYNIFVLILSIISSVPVFNTIYTKIRKENLICKILEYIILLILLICSIMSIVSNGYNPFIYFQF